MTANSASTTAHVYHEGMVVRCIYDHQMHDKLNYLNRYTVLSVKKDVDDCVYLEIITEDKVKTQCPQGWFIPEWYYEGKEDPMDNADKPKAGGAIAQAMEETRMETRKRRMDEKAAEDPQPVVKRGQYVPGFENMDEEVVAQAQQFENVPDMVIAHNLAKPGKNPKQQYADKKPRLTLAPLSAQTAQVEAQLDGKLKYGEVNWRINRIEALTYVDAALRHLRLYENGENYARDTKVYNLGAVMACCAILIDSELHGTLDDNRKHSPQTCDMLHDRGEQMTKHLQEMQKVRDAANG